MKVKVKVTFTSGSLLTREYDTYDEALRYCQTGISYSGGKVKRVEIAGCHPVWDLDWDAVSKAYGLRGTA